MAGFSIRKGTVFEREQAPVRIVRIATDGAVVLEDLRTGRAYTCNKEDLLDEYLAGKLVGCDVAAAHSVKPVRYERPLDDLPDAVKAEAFKRKRYLDYLAEAGRVPWSNAQMGELIRAAAEVFRDNKPPAVSTLYRWHRRLLLANDVRALVPQYHRRGPTKPHTSAEVLTLFAQALDQTSKTMQRNSMADVEAELRVLIEQENYGRPVQQQLKMPTRRTLYRIAPRLEEYGLTSSEAGAGHGRRKIKLTSHSVRTKGILERVEIDHTPMDVFVVDDKTLLPWGRPLLTMLIDHYSRMPTGYYLSFGGPSANAVLKALRHAILPKRPAASVIPGLHVNYQWPCYGLIHRLVVDNGLEFHSDALERAGFELNMDVSYCPVRQPRFKGTIERFLKTLNYGFAHCLPGTSLAHFTQRGDYDPLKHAILTLGELKQVLEKWLLDVYAQTPHRSLDAAPYQVWEASAAANPPRLPQEAIHLMPALGIPTTRHVRHDGITLAGLRYSADALISIMQRFREGVSVRVVYDPEDLGKILVWAPGENAPFVAPAVWVDYADGLTLIQHRLIRAIAREHRMDEQRESSLLYAKSELAQAMRDLMSNRSLRSRKKFARIHGANSAQPAKRLLPDEAHTNGRESRRRGASKNPTLCGIKPFPRMRIR